MTHRDESASDEDEVWQSIIDNYGTRPELPAEPTHGSVPMAAERPAPDGEPLTASLPGESDSAFWTPAGDDRFVPEVPPPFPRPDRPRLIAWIGVLGAPLALLVVAIFRVPLPTILIYALIGWAIAGFGFLVAVMPRGPQDPYDDGARV